MHRKHAGVCTYATYREHQGVLCHLPVFRFRMSALLFAPVKLVGPFAPCPSGSTAYRLPGLLNLISEEHAGVSPFFFGALFCSMDLGIPSALTCFESRHPSPRFGDAPASRSCALRRQNESPWVKTTGRRENTSSRSRLNQISTSGAPHDSRLSVARKSGGAAGSFFCMLRAAGIFVRRRHATPLSLSRLPSSETACHLLSTSAQMYPLCHRTASHIDYCKK